MLKADRTQNLFNIQFLGNRWTQRISSKKLQQSLYLFLNILLKKPVATSRTGARKNMVVPIPYITLSLIRKKPFFFGASHIYSYVLGCITHLLIRGGADHTLTHLGGGSRKLKIMHTVLQSWFLSDFE